MIHLRVYGKIFNIFCFQTTRLYSRFGSFKQNKIQSSNSHTVHITVYSKLAVTYCIDLQIMVYSTLIAVVALWWSSSGYQEHENSSAADGQLLVNILLRGYRCTGTSQPWEVSQHTEQGWERSESRGIKRGERKGWGKVGGVWVCEEGKKHIVEVRGRRSIVGGGVKARVGVHREKILYCSWGRRRRVRKYLHWAALLAIVHNKIYKVY